MGDDIDAAWARVDAETRAEIEERFGGKGHAQ
jgi:hypothetical protein